MTEKRFTLKYIEEQHLSANLYDDKTFIGSIRIGAELIVELLNALSDENEQLTHDATVLIQANQDYRRENEQLKQQINDCKKDEKQLSISFMEFKMQLIDVLQQNYNYAYSQRQKNLDKAILARSYELLYQTIDIIAETMNVDIERFPKR